MTIHIYCRGISGLPGLEFRINSKGFLYASLLAGAIVNNEIKRFRLQPLKQCFQRVVFSIRNFFTNEKKSLLNDK